MDEQGLVDTLLKYDRVVLSAELELASGSYFQPTGFPDIGPCRFVDGHGNRRCLVESEQSMANRLEGVCMRAPGEWRAPFEGKLPIIKVRGRKQEGNSGPLLATNLTEPHRLASSYVLEGDLENPKNDEKKLQQVLEKRLGIADGTWSLEDRDKLVQTVFALDPGAVLHGYQFMQWGVVGLRQQRLLESRIEAVLPEDNEVHYALVKIDNIEPDGFAEKSNKGQAIGHKERLVPSIIEAIFELDVMSLRERPLVEEEKKEDGHTKNKDGNPTNDECRKFLLALALWKIHRFLTDSPAYDPRTGETGGALRLRSGCKLQFKSLKWCGWKNGRVVPPPDATTNSPDNEAGKSDPDVGKHPDPYRPILCSALVNGKQEQDGVPQLLADAPPFKPLVKGVLETESLEVTVHYDRKAKLSKS